MFVVARVWLHKLITSRKTDVHTSLMEIAVWEGVTPLAHRETRRLVLLDPIATLRCICWVPICTHVA